MDIYDDDVIRIWRALSENSVRYIMVGGFATYFHGFERSTQDIDIWLEDTLENRKKLRSVLATLDFGDFPMIETMQFVAEWSSIKHGNIELDIMTNMKGLENLTFDDCLARASVAEIDGIEIPFLHINDLIANKKTVNRPKDQIDVIELEKIKSLRDQL
jgi:predicted nucleotidyltransferase